MRHCAGEETARRHQQIRCLVRRGPCLQDPLTQRGSMAPALTNPARRRTQEKAAPDMERGVAQIDSGQFPDLSFPFAGAWGHVVVAATGTKHRANAPRHVVQPVFSPSPTGRNSSGGPVSHSKAKTWHLALFPSLHGAVLLCQSLPGPGQRKSCSLHPPCEASAAPRAGSRAGRARRDL